MFLRPSSRRMSVIARNTEAGTASASASARATRSSASESVVRVAGGRAWSSFRNRKSSLT